MNNIIYNAESLIYRFLVFIKTCLISTLMYILRIFPIKKNRIIVISYYGKEYGANGKYVVEQLLKSNIKYEIYWAISNMDAYTPEGIKKVLYKSLKYYYILVTSKIWMNNCRFPRWIRKRKNQKYFQLWHGSIVLKKVEFDVPEKLGNMYIKSAANDNKLIDFLFSNSRWCTDNLYRGAFKCNKKIYEFGIPRNDILVNKDIEIYKKVKKHFGIDLNCNVLLYAPTFRKKYNGQYNIDFHSLVKKLEEKHGKKWVVLLRLHPNVRNNASKYGIKFDKKILDACLYDDMQELIIASNLIITDYSSVMFEGIVANIPVLLYTSDIVNYNSERGTYFELDDLPFKYAMNNEELLSLINKYSLDDMKSEYNNFTKKIGLKETGHASEKIREVIDEIVSKE